MLEQFTRGTAAGVLEDQYGAVVWTITMINTFNR
jgi:hypothetical protein